MEGGLTEARSVPEEVRLVLGLFTDRVDVTPRLDETAVVGAISTSNDRCTALPQGTRTEFATDQTQPRGKSDPAATDTYQHPLMQLCSQPSEQEHNTKTK